MIPKYISAEQYGKQSGISPEEVRRLCRTGEIKCQRTKGGYYKIPVYEDSVPREELDKAKQEITRLKTIITTMLKTGEQMKEV